MFGLSLTRTVRKKALRIETAEDYNWDIFTTQTLLLKQLRAKKQAIKDMKAEHAKATADDAELIDKLQRDCKMHSHNLAVLETQADIKRLPAAGSVKACEICGAAPGTATLTDRTYAFAYFWMRNDIYHAVGGGDASEKFIKDEERIKGYYCRRLIRHCSSCTHTWEERILEHKPKPRRRKAAPKKARK